MSGPVIVDTAAAAAAVHRKPADIRRWAQRGLLAPAGTDDRGRRLYRLPDVYRVAQLHPPRKATSHDRPPRPTVR